MQKRTKREQKEISLVCQPHCIFKNRNLTKTQAKGKLNEWHKSVSSSSIKEIISTKDCIRSKQDEALNYFDNFPINTAAESLNSKMKGFRAELKGVRDLPFYLYRCCMISD